MQHKATRAVFNYWNEVRGARMAPRRLEIEPRRIAPFLSETIILETDPSSGPRLRLAGTRICQFFGRELRGVLLRELCAHGDWVAIERALDPVFSGGVAELSLEGRTIKGEAVDFECIILPLVHTGQSIDRMLVVLSGSSTPTWFGDDKLHHLTLISAETIWPARNAAWPRAPEPAPQPTTQPPVLTDLANARCVISAHRKFRVINGGQSNKR